MNDTWNNAQAHEAEYWGNCLGMRAWGEFVKQEMYGREMGLFAEYGDGHGELDMHGKSVLDVGGGPVSMTLRCYNACVLTVADPLQWPDSVMRRYRHYGIEFIQTPGEELLEHLRTSVGFLYDEVWIYNVLQHCDDPVAVLSQACTLGKVLRIFEWLHIPADACHPHVLTPELILNGLHADMKVRQIKMPRLREYWSDADAFVGVFEN